MISAQAKKELRDWYVAERDKAQEALDFAINNKMTIRGHASSGCMEDITTSYIVAEQHTVVELNALIERLDGQDA